MLLESLQLCTMRKLNDFYGGPLSMSMHKHKHKLMSNYDYDYGSIKIMIMTRQVNWHRAQTVGKQAMD
jgi:hypothetical protein